MPRWSPASPAPPTRASRRGWRTSSLRAPRIACHTPRRAGRLGLTAVSAELSGDSARRAAESAGWTVVEAATADDGRSLAARLAALQAAEVDAWLLTGGFDDARADQALEMAGLVAAARGQLPTAGDLGRQRSADRAEVSILFEEGAVRAGAEPAAGAAQRERAAAAPRAGGAAAADGGARRRAAADAGLVPRAISELARSTMRRVLGVDLGARYLSWVIADEGGSAESRVFAGWWPVGGQPGGLRRTRTAGQDAAAGDRRAGRGGCAAEPARPARHAAPDRR